MFDIHIDATSLLIAGGVALFYDFCVSWLLHLRYDRQFGWSFVASGLVTFSLPSLLLVGLPHYLVLSAPLALPLKMAFLFAFQIVFLRLLMRLQARILSKIFKDPRKQASTTDELANRAYKAPATGENHSEPEDLA